MNLLAIDTCCGNFSIAVYRSNECIDYYIAKEKNLQAERLISKLDELLERQKMTYADFDLFACSVGPGSFTGIRIGISALQGINLVCKKPTIGVSTLEAIAVHSKGDIIATLNAGRGQVYHQKFKGSLAVSEIKIAGKSELQSMEKINFIGELGNSELPDAKKVAAAALKKNEKQKMKNSQLEPLYIRPPEAVEKRINQNK